jgi:hypothetical protein
VRLKDKIVFILIFSTLLFISLNRHSRHPLFSYHSQLFADKAGYQVYLSAYFYYDMDASKMPADIVNKTGNGFWFKDNKVITKYPIGVAFFEAPFFAIAALLDEWNNVELNLGFTVNQQKALNWSTAFFATCGLLILFLTAVKFWNLTYGQAYLLITAIFLCSNLLYYSTRDCGMSHAYSFFVFAVIQYVVFKCLKAKTVCGSDIILLPLLFSLLIILRPLNLIFVSLPVSYIIFVNRKELKGITFRFSNITLLIAVLLTLIPILLQGLYNVYAFNSFFADSYASESFSKLFSMDLLALWFSPNNGALLYSPILIGVFVWSYFQIKDKKYLSTIYLFYFLLISFTYAAWWSPGLGCGFGHRGFTEHLAFFALPIGQLIATFSKWKVYIFGVFTLCIGIALFIAQLHFDGCMPGGIWEWNSFFNLFRV